MRNGSYFDRSYVAISNKNWEVAYRFIEGKLISKDETERGQAIAMVKAYPEMLNAGIETFTEENLKDSIKNYGEEQGIDIERKRLEMIKVVTNNTTYKNIKYKIDELAIHIDAIRAEAAKELSEKQRQSNEIKLSKEKEEKLRFQILRDKKNKSFFYCKNKRECDKSFSLTQIFISKNSTMKIQVATETILETYNPTSYGIGMGAYKIPQEGDSALIKLIVNCKNDNVEINPETNKSTDYCYMNEIDIYEQYPKFISENLKK